VRLTERTGEPVAGALVEVADRPFGRTDAQGRIRLPLAADAAARLRLLSADGRQASLLLKALPPGAPEHPLTLAEPLVLAGRVIDAESRAPVPGALVWASADPGAFVRADGEGRFRLTLPTRRRPELEIAAAGFLPRKAALSGAQVASRRGSTFALARAAGLRGKVVDPQGRPLPGAAVAAVAERALGGRAFAASDPVTERAFSGPQGQFELRLLHPGQGYEVRASRPGAFPAAGRVTAGDPAAQPRALTLVLAPARPVRGKVQDPAGKPIADAEVVLRPALRPGLSPAPGADAEGTTARSDAKGLFAVAEAPAAEIELAARKKGYAPAILPALRIPAGKGPAGQGPADLGIVVLRPGARLAGRVLDQRGKAIADAGIFLLPQALDVNQAERALERRKPAATSAADGAFALEDLIPGVPVHLAIRAAGFLTLQRAVRPPAEPPITLRLQPAAALAGRVVDEEGDPIAGARVDFRWQAALPEEPDRPVGIPVFREARAGADGRFELRGVPLGTAQVSASAAGFVPREPFEVVLPRPAQAGELRVVLTRGAVLQGRVTNAAGEPVPAVRVGLGGSSAATDDDGLYWLEGAPPGHQEVLFVHASYGRLAKRFDVQPGVNLLDIAFPPGVEVAGRVVDDTGKPVPAARVELDSENHFDLKHHQDVTGEDGRFRLAPVTPGRYRLKAGAEGYSDTESPGTLAVASDPIAGLEIALDRGAALTGNILGLPPEDLAQVTVEARGDRGNTVAAWTDGRGRYEVRPLYPGDWVVKALLWDGQRQAQARVAIGKSDREVTRDLEFAKRLTLTLQVLYDDEPLPEAKISVRGARLAVERAATTDDQGRARLDDLEPDTYRVGVRHPQDLLVHNEQIELQQDRDAVIRLQGATLGGAVVSATDRTPVPSALLSLRPLEGPEFLITAATQDDGRFALYHVQPGRYRLEARAKGFTPATQDLQVAAGQVIEDLELRLTPTPGVRLQVRLASGQTPAFVHLLVRDPAGATILAETRHADASGLFELTTLPPGTWTLFLCADGAALTTASLTVPSPEPLALTLPPATRLSVRVPALAASDLIGTVRLLTQDQQPFWTLGPGGQVVQQWPLVGGRAVVEGVSAGAWAVQVETPDGQKWQGVATTSGAADAAVTIE
jgi:protocatechuate 3,4-dioxygenase beta subunit